MFSYFSTNTLTELPKNYKSYDTWKEELQMDAVLKELYKDYPNTRKLYKQFFDHKLGYINNVLDKQMLIDHYQKIVNPIYINFIISNYKINGQCLIDRYSIRTKKDANIFVYILNTFLKITTNKYVYNVLCELIDSIKTNKIIIDPYFIISIIYRKEIIKYYPTIIDIIINYRQFENEASQFNYI